MTITGDQINEVLFLVMAMDDDGDTQISILARALVVAAKSCSVPCENVLEGISEIFEENTKLVPIKELQH